MSTPIERQDLDGGVVRLSLASGGGNPLTPELLAHFRELLDELEARPPRALVLDGGRGKLFSGGFDVPTIAGYDRAQLSEFFGGFLEIMRRLVVLPAPTIAGIHASAIAGGFILSLACDFRVVEKVGLRLGLTEVDLGIAVPAGTQVILADRTSLEASRRMCMFGTLLAPDEAQRIGYADELHVDARARALELASFLARKPGDAVAVTKSFTAHAVAARMKAADDEHMDAFLDSWLSDVGQAALRKLAEKLRG
ncbi:MAG: enoyl-CoA hydratase/isomerase family protein [Myxococcota bacterium]